MYQRALLSKSGVSSTRWPSLVTCGGSSAGRWVSFTRTIWLGALCRIARRVGSGSDGATSCRTSTSTPSGSMRRTTEPPPGPAAASYRTAERLRQFLKVVRARNRQTQPDEPGLRAARHAIDVGSRTGSAQEHLVLGLRDDDQPKIAKVLLGAFEIRALEMDEQEIVCLHDRRDAAWKFDAARTARDNRRMQHGFLLEKLSSGRLWAETWRSRWRMG